MTMKGNLQRTEDTRERLQEMELDALVLRLPENVLFLGGFWPMIGMSFLIFPAEGKPVCIVPHCYENEAQQELWESEAVHFNFGLTDSPDPFFSVAKILSSIAKGKGWERIGYEGTPGNVAVSWNSSELVFSSSLIYEIYKKSFNNAELVDITSTLAKWKSRKTEYEIDRIRLASDISCLGLEVFDLIVKPGNSGVEIAAKVEMTIMAKGTGFGGSRRVRAYAQVATGSSETSMGYRPNEISTPRKLKDGDLSLLELGVTVDGYWADRTRVRIAGNPSEMQSTIFDLVVKAQESAITAVGVGVASGDVDEAARAVIRDAGYGDSFPHITGHGVGFAYHEPYPILRPGSPLILEEGMIHSIEPGIYIPSMGGIRVEDDILVTSSGAVVLGPYEKELK